jgi:hypothetical protein
VTRLKKFHDHSRMAQPALQHHHNHEADPLSRYQDFTCVTPFEELVYGIEVSSTSPLLHQCGAFAHSGIAVCGVRVVGIRCVGVHQPTSLVKQPHTRSPRLTDVS